MSSADTRSVENRLLMCILHSYEIDEHETRFSPELLQEWRVGQIREYFDRRHGWPIDEDEAAEVLPVSFDSPMIAAPVLTSVVDAAELFALRAVSTRPGPAAAAAWRRTRAQANAIIAHDDEGNRVFVEPLNITRQQHERAVLAALDGVRAVSAPLYVAMACLARCGSGALVFAIMCITITIWTIRIRPPAVFVEPGVNSDRLRSKNV